MSILRVKILKHILFLDIVHQTNLYQENRLTEYLEVQDTMIGLNLIGAQTMRKTYAWNYYKETGDIYHLQKLFNHASPSITYRFIGENAKH